jgi:hypothetical protein
MKAQGRKMGNKTDHRIDHWKRFQYGDIPIYFNTQAPDWFVPNRAVIG